MSALRLSLLLSASLACAAPVPAQTPSVSPGDAQTQTAAPGQGDAGAVAALSDSIDALGARIDQLHQALVGCNVGKWKASGQARSVAQSDIDSMQRDVSGTLPDLLTRARGAQGAVGPAFAVFRNVDALYDVLLRVTGTATMAGAPDAQRLEEARVSMQEGRSQLGNALLEISNRQDAELAQLRASARAAAEAAARRPAQNTTVEDGPPATTKSRTRRKKATPPAGAPPAGTPPPAR